jgi:SpoVK/Ycf46/Vps4 family AAA+-type ATPase
VASAVGQRVERIDLGSLVVSKYIGETEKNLNKVLACAESLDSVLFVDEADALFGTRVEVKDAHDRYSEQEVSLVLERLRAHEGIVVFGHAPKLGEKPRREAVRRFHKLVKSSARGAELWSTLCAP